MKLFPSIRDVIANAGPMRGGVDYAADCGAVLRGVTFAISDNVFEGPELRTLLSHLRSRTIEEGVVQRRIDVFGAYVEVHDVLEEDTEGQ